MASVWEFLQVGDRTSQRRRPATLASVAAATNRKQPADGADARLDDHGYDALIVVSFGGPEGMDDVIPFLENVTRGRNIPRERLAEVGHHYELFGGVSPINQQNRDLIAALEVELAAHGIDLPIFFGNRNWDPYLADTLRTMRAAGVAALARVLHLSVQLLLRLPSVPRGHLQRPGGCRAGRARGAEAPHLLQPPRLRRSQRRSRARGA